MPARKPGRPTKYQASFCADLLDAMERGMTFEGFAGELRVSKQTLYSWAERYPAFMDAKNVGEALRERFYIRLGLGLVTGKVEGNATVYVWMTKNILKWRDNRAIEHSGPEGGAIRVASRAMTRDERRAEIARLTQLHAICGDD